MQFALVFQASAPREAGFARARVASFTVLSGMYEAMFNAEAQAMRRSGSTPTAWKNLFALWAELLGPRAAGWAPPAAEAAELPARSRSATQNWSANIRASRTNTPAARVRGDPAGRCAGVGSGRGAQ